MEYLSGIERVYEAFHDEWASYSTPHTKVVQVTVEEWTGPLFSKGRVARKPHNPTQIKYHVENVPGFVQKTSKISYGIQNIVQKNLV